MIRTIAEHQFPSGQVLSLHHGDITEEHCDAIVNAANPQLAHGGGVARAIARRAGPQLKRESKDWVRQHGPVSHARPAITGAGKLPCRFVIHAVGPVWGEGDEDSKLRTAISSALDLAAKQGLRSIALPAVSTGIFGFPKPRAAGLILDAVASFTESEGSASLTDIRITLYDQPTLEAFQGAFRQRWPIPEE